MGRKQVSQKDSKATGKPQKQSVLDKFLVPKATSATISHMRDIPSNARAERDTHEEIDDLDDDEDEDKFEAVAQRLSRALAHTRQKTTVQDSQQGVRVPQSSKRKLSQNTESTTKRIPPSHASASLSGAAQPGSADESIQELGGFDEFDEDIRALGEEYGIDLESVHLVSGMVRGDGASHLNSSSIDKLDSSSLGQKAVGFDEYEGRPDDSDDYDEFDVDEQEDPATSVELFAARRKRFRKIGRPRLNKLEPHLAGLLGEANMLFMTKDFDKALSMLSEVIRQCPQSSDAYHTLGLIYENLGHKKRAFDAYLIAAALTPRDLSLWKRLSSMARQLGLIQQAVFCLSRIVRLDPTDMDSLLACSLLQYQLKHYKKAADGFQMLLRANPGDFDLMKNLARAFHNAKQTEKAISILKEVMQLQLQLDLDCVNMLCELHMGIRQYVDVISIIRNVESKVQELPLDLSVKMGMCYILTNRHDLAEKVLVSLLQSDVEVYGDLFADVAQTYISVELFEHALRFLDRMKEHPEYSQPALWLRRAYCSKMLGNLSEAQQLYEKVLADNPDSSDASMDLAAIHQSRGDQAKALEILTRFIEARKAKVALSQQPTAESQLPPSSVDTPVFSSEIDLTNTLALLRKVMDDSAVTIVPLQEALDVDLCRAILEAAYLHLSSGHEREFIETLEPIMRPAFSNLGVSSKRRNPSAIKDSLMTGADIDEIFSSSSNPDFLLDHLEHEEFFDLACKYIVALIRNGHFKDARKHIYSLIVSARYSPTPEKQDRLRILQISACFLGNDASHALTLMRGICASQPDRNFSWTFFCRLQLGLPIRVSTHKFLLRLEQRFPNIAALRLVVGHYFLIAGSYRQALQRYLAAKGLGLQQPTVDLMCGVCYLSMVCQKYTADRHYTLLQAVCYFDQYIRRCRSKAESAYNMGRAYHELGLMFLAQQYYAEALEECQQELSRDAKADEALSEAQHSSQTRQLDSTPTALQVKSLREEQIAQITVIRRVAAHNLAMILRESGSLDLARDVLRRHFVV
eukprot:TRINITY_DN5134_c0_g1_i1.p1 TRINITY_DN5134_c0_g1~~TRINITY_DN5134_c0_g1_i1.p1  ORF type:complete len:1031 (-),score=223.18 TRINITY_DN5134_c0_g1_i1:100-3192(-)